MIERAVQNLNRHGFDAHYCATRTEAIDFVMRLVTPQARVGCGGSLTLRQLGLPALIKQVAAEVYDHWEPGLTGEQVMALRRKQLLCDLFLTSANAIAATGEIVNREGYGNRTNALTFGPAKAVAIAGRNKLAPDLEGAIALIEQVAAPGRSVSLGLDNPCVKAGECLDCDEPSRICLITSILHRRPLGSDISVLLVDEDLGC